jgi:hypothetical protein
MVHEHLGLLARDRMICYFPRVYHRILLRTFTLQLEGESFSAFDAASLQASLSAPSMPGVFNLSFLLWQSYSCFWILSLAYKSESFQIDLLKDQEVLLCSTGQKLAPNFSSVSRPLPDSRYSTVVLHRTMRQTSGSLSTQDSGPCWPVSFLSIQLYTAWTLSRVL